jgi:16S rRNA (adenine1518-N6/adenine1519-N6)-dimethyltransferase
MTTVGLAPTRSGQQMQTKQQIQSLLALAKIRPRHRFGQNFMIDQNLLRLVAEAGNISAGDQVIEIGPGTGTLSEELLARGAKVIAVEIDRDLAAHLRGHFKDQANFTLIEGDALDGKRNLNSQLMAAIEARKAKLVANLPYNIASPLIIELLNAGLPLLVFTVQKEVAQRLRASAGSEEYGALSVMTQLLSRVEVLRTLPPSAFWPAPKIDSSLVRLTRDDRLGPKAHPFSIFLQQLFSSRRKTLRKTLANLGHDAEAILHGCKLDADVRAEDLPPQQLLLLFEAVRR